MPRIYISLLIFSCILSTNVLAQQPSFIRAGEAFFKDKDIYSLIQGDDQTIWISTNLGLIQYDGYQFKTYTNTQAKSNALFNLQKDYHGQIYCYNLNGQIFRIENDSLYLHYEIPDSLISNQFEYSFDDQNRLFIAAKSFFYLDAQKHPQIIYDLSKSISVSRTNNIIQTNDSSLLFTLYATNSVARWKNNKLTVLPQAIIPRSENKKEEEYILLKSDQELIAQLFYYPNILIKKNDKWKSIPLQIAPKYKDQRLSKSIYLKNKTIWMAYLNKGCHVFDTTGRALYGGQLLFPKYLISSFLEDKDGNLWFGTFKKGLLILPNKTSIDFTLNPDFKNDEITAICKGPDESVFVGGMNGIVYKIDSNLNCTKNYKLSSQIINTIASNKQYLFFTDHIINLSTNQTTSFKGKGNIKEIQFVNNSEVIFASHLGVTYKKLSSNKSKPKFLTAFKKLGGKHCKKSSDSILIHNRSNCIYYDSEENNLWSGLSPKLVTYTEDSSHTILHNNKPVISKSITKVGKLIYIGTNTGILIVQNRKVIGQLTLKDGLLSNKITKLKPYKQKLCIASDNGFQLFDPIERTFLSIKLQDGLLRKYVRNFTFTSKHLWLLTAGSVQRYALETLNLNKEKHLPKPQILVNNSPIYAKRYFPFKKNNLQVQFQSPLYTYTDSAAYFYRLKEIDSTWIKLQYSNNTFRLNALANGSYTLQVKVCFDGSCSATNTCYFEITPPYWKTWWFYLICTLLTGALLSLFYILRLKRIKLQHKLHSEKQQIENELIESQQTALRAQMNPHFMFNALNSIQEMIILNEKREAAKYLSMFAHLMRIYLEQSQQNEISLKEELEAIKLYLNLEKIRFEDNTTIVLDIDATLDTELIRMPPMFIQPYIENAFKHGLLHKKEDRLLNVTFKRNEMHTHLICIIEDNGVGQKISAEINKIRNSKHQSFSTSATKKRLQLLNKNKVQHISVEIEDLINNLNIGCGTKVTIKFPL